MIAQPIQLQLQNLFRFKYAKYKSIHFCTNIFCLMFVVTLFFFMINDFLLNVLNL